MMANGKLSLLSVGERNHRRWRRFNRWAMRAGRIWRAGAA